MIDYIIVIKASRLWHWQNKVSFRKQIHNIEKYSQKIKRTKAAVNKANSYSSMSVLNILFS